MIVTFKVPLSVEFPRARILKWVATTPGGSFTGKVPTVSLLHLLQWQVGSLRAITFSFSHRVFCSAVVRLVVPLLIGRQACAMVWSTRWHTRSRLALPRCHQLCMADVAHAEVEMETQRCKGLTSSLGEMGRTEISIPESDHPCLWTFGDPVTFLRAGETSCPPRDRAEHTSP